MEKVIVCGVECTTQEQVDAALTAAIAKAKADGISEAESGISEKLAAAKTAGSTAERERIQAVECQALPGHEKLIVEMKTDGKTTGPEAAVRILAAEKAKTAQTAKDLVSDAPKAAPSSEPGQSAAADETKVDSKAVAKAAQDYVDSEAKLGRKVRFSEAVTHVMKQSK